MANTFLRKMSRNVGNVAVSVGSYTVGAGNTAIVLGLTICNVTGASVNTSVYVNDGSQNYYLVKDAPVPGGGALVVVGGDQKVVLQASDSMRVISDTPTSLDAVMSIMEIS